jgi:glycosyltransferase involved in cell wall biosynthesis
MLFWLQPNEEWPALDRIYMEHSRGLKVETCNIPDEPLISVVMPVYNAERYVADAINSILTQTYRHFEFIIVDDGSTDGSPSIVRDFAARDARIHLLLLRHGGVAQALNAGVAMAQGELTARMDADDIALSERFAIQVRWMHETGVDICGSYAKRFGSEDGIWWVPETHQAICHEMVWGPPLLHSTVMLHTRIARAHPYDPQSAAEDYELFTRLALLYRMGNVPQILLKRRCHAQQIRQLHSTALQADFTKFRRSYFEALFPDATTDDYAAVARITGKEPFPVLADLKRAGKWLVRLAETPDAFVRERMADRWREACQKSTHLGLGCYRLYREIAPLFGVAINQGTFRLWLGCGLRLKSDSQLYAILASAKRRMTSPR